MPFNLRSGSNGNRPVNLFNLRTREGLLEAGNYDNHFAMPLYEYECANGHRFEAIQKLNERPLTQCSMCSADARRTISQPTLLHNRGIHVFDRVTKDDALRGRPSSLKSLKKDKF